MPAAGLLEGRSSPLTMPFFPFHQPQFTWKSDVFVLYYVTVGSSNLFMHAFDSMEQWFAEDRETYYVLVSQFKPSLTMHHYLTHFFLLGRRQNANTLNPFCFLFLTIRFTDLTEILERTEFPSILASL
jgi:hypothetical protein